MTTLTKNIEEKYLMPITIAFEWFISTHCRQ